MQNSSLRNENTIPHFLTLGYDGLAELTLSFLSVSTAPLFILQIRHVRVNGSNYQRKLLQ
jgi:hypothetical protein